MKLLGASTPINPEGRWRITQRLKKVARMLQRVVVDGWTRDKAFAEAVDVLQKIYAKYR